MIDLDLVIAGTRSVPALPQSATRLCSLLSSDDWDLEQVVETVKIDPVLTGRILKAANSVASAGLAAITDPTQAAIRIGPGGILAVAMSAAAKKCLDVTLPCYGLSEGQLLKNSVAAALTVECARRYCKQSPPPEAFAAALLHDVGILVLASQLDEQIIELLRRSREEGKNSLIAAEQEILAVDHGEVGGLIARQWELPNAVVEAITFHHAPTDAPSEEGSRLADFVALGDLVASVVHQGGERVMSAEEEEQLLARLGLDEDDFRDLVSEVDDEFEAVLARYK